MFVQYRCQQDVIKVEAKKKDALFIAMIELVGLGLFLFTILFNYKKTKKMDKFYTRYMVMANDYSLYFSFNSKQRLWFNSQFNNMSSGASRGSEMKQYLTNLLKLDGIEIIRIDLVFNNKTLIDFMERRGTAIKNQ